MALDRKFEDAKDQHVATTILYGDGTSKLYTDAAKTVEVDHDTALDLCFKGLVVFDTDTYYAVSSFSDSAGALTITTSDDTAYTVAASA